MTTVLGPTGVLRRALRNAGLLLTGKISAGLIQLGSFALAARGLGLNDFGIFSMLLAQVQLLTGLAAFQSNHAIVRYGVEHLRTGNRRAFQALIKAGTLLDLGAAIFAMVATFLLVPLISDYLGWGRDITRSAQLISVLALTNAIATPKGMLRLFGRFDLLTQHTVVTPAARLVGVAICYAAGASLAGYIVFWLIAGLLGAAVALWLGWREARRRDLLHGLDGSLRGLTDENPGIWRFTIISNLNSSLKLIPDQLSTFLVGIMLTPAAAGLFKIARELGTAFAKPVELLNQSVYPDVARLVGARQWRRLSRTVLHAGLLAAGSSALAAILVAAGGRTLIGFVFGEEFISAQLILLLIAIATTVTVLVFAVEPVLYALGKPSRSLVTTLAASFVFTAGLLYCLPRYGLSGAGMAYLISGLVTVGFSIFWYWKLVVVPYVREPGEAKAGG
ncbi:lipopolysaccharide biosynthesis protein [Tsuneonella sp. CC-YZS046]|uniref:lipopolysaccharide biosynthesis protein n=1 Tax=Tsuneonella sp. CC-YZS046 TaxID=3042152 RepID=UPI002D76AABA|nr:lipopolysaccharide biosynthesis protein [Tsuneonella sp. CC-YZS046]WRO65863.1 lipopolysaccharide biosynthesis protein [Tsuneonella sp. CC-YZS046]